MYEKIFTIGLILLTRTAGAQTASQVSPPPTNATPSPEQIPDEGYVQLPPEGQVETKPEGQVEPIQPMTNELFPQQRPDVFQALPGTVSQPQTGTPQ